MEEGVNDWKNVHSKFCWHEKSSIHIETVSKLLENRNENDIVKLFGKGFKSSQARIQNYSYSLKTCLRQMLGCLASNYAPGPR